MRTKICRDCRLAKPLSDFAGHDRCQGGVRPECKACGVDTAKAHRQKIYALRDAGLLPTAAEKICPQCKKILPSSEFRTNRAVHSGLSAYCRTCYREKDKRQRRKQLSKSLCWAAKRRAKTKGIDFDLDPDKITIPDMCPVFQVPMKSADRRSGEGTRFSPSIDRIDNSKGYTMDNIIIVSRLANTIKSDATTEQLRAVADFYSSLACR